MENTSFKPVKIRNAAYIELLAIINNKIYYNEVITLLESILSLDIDTAKMVAWEIRVYEKSETRVTIYDLLDELKNALAKYVEISPVKYIKK